MFKRRKIIDITKIDLKCDNDLCDYSENCNPDIDYKEYVGKPCPKCGENLLTSEDLKGFEKFVSISEWVNKWIGWITVFYPGAKTKDMYGNYHNGNLNIKKAKEEDV